MGGPLSRLLADLIIENKIETQIAKHPKWGKLWDWVRLIDDTLSVWESENTFQEFFLYLNTLHPHIQWTNETEKNGKLAIFDIQIIRTEAGYATTVYRKPAASNRYIHYRSAQAWKEKATAIRTLKARAIEYCSDAELLANELAYLLEVFIQNGYPENTVWRMLYQENQAKDKDKEDINLDKSFFIPYHSRARRLIQILKEKFGIATIYKRTQTLGDIILKKGRQVKTEYKKNAVYKIPCAECPKKYVGQTSGTLKKRTAEHTRWCRKKHKKQLLQSSKKNDGIAYHHHYTGHQIDFDNVEIITQEKSYWRRLIIEGIEIKWLGEDRANLQLGYEVHECWDPILAKLHCIPTNTGT